MTNIKEKYGIQIGKGDDLNDFYLMIPISAAWYNHFSNLDSEQEEFCEELFLHKGIRMSEIKKLVKNIHERVSK